MIAALFAASNPCYPQWVQQSVPTDLTLLLTVDFLNTEVGVAAGYNWSTNFLGRAIYSTNSGQNWTLAQVPDSARSLVTVSFVGSETAYIVGAYNLSPFSDVQGFPLPAKEAAPTNALKAIGMERYLHRVGLNGGGGYRGLFLASTDRGMTWHTKGVLPDSVFYMIGAAFVNTSVGYATVDAHPQVGLARILKTTNGGNSWRRLTTPDSIPYLRNITVLDSMKAVAVGYQYRNQTVSGIILHTTDAGDTWPAQEFPAVDNFTDVFFMNSSTGFAVGVFAPPLIRGAIYKTTDAGMTWSPLNFAPDSVLFEGVRFAKEPPVGVVYGERIMGQSFLPFVVRTTDGGLTWNEGVIDSVRDNSVLIGGRLLTPLVGYLCGGDVVASAAMLHTTNGGVTSVGEHSIYEIKRYSLSQNFPNPFNPTTRINFSVGSQANVTLKIFTILGTEVATLVSESFSSGGYFVDWNATGLPSGVYFCRMQAGPFGETRKLLLLR